LCWQTVEQQFIPALAIASAVVSNSKIIMRFVFLFLLLSPVLLYSQESNFEGIIWFSTQYESHEPRISENQLKEQFGDRYLCYIKDGNYRQEYFNSSGIEYVVYESSSNLYYYKLKNIDTLFYIDCANYSDKIKIEETDSIVKIAGYDCTIVKTKKYNPGITVIYYFAKDLYLDPSKYKKHKLGAYNKLTNNYRSVYLKQETEYEPYKTIITADSVNVLPVDESLFTLPDLPKKRK
jgi:hypothetical protein